MQNVKMIWTIGHSTRTLEDFSDLLKINEVTLLVDVRAFPGSRRYPHFNSEDLARSMNEIGTEYKHMAGLGGRRKPVENSSNSVWRHAAFRGYADYMQTAEFKEHIDLLEHLAAQRRTAMMCSEALWWKCHRALVSDFLKAKGWVVMHIMEKGNTSEHPFTSPARHVQGQLFY